MGRKQKAGFINRRRLLQYFSILGIGGQTFLNSGDARAEINADRKADEETADWPKMSYRKLGRTNFNASRLIFGCGATLMFFPRDDLLNSAYDAGINVFDVGYRDSYRNAVENLAPFLRKVRDRIFLISKAVVDLEAEADERITVQQAKQAADTWGRRLDASLSELQPLLDKVRESGMGLIGMKASRQLSGLPILGWWNKPHAFDKYYDENLLAAPLTGFQRSYAYVLAHGLDVVNADMQSLAHLKENVIAATTSQSYFA